MSFTLFTEDDFDSEILHDAISMNVEDNSQTYSKKYIMYII